MDASLNKKLVIEVVSVSVEGSCNYETIRGAYENSEIMLP